MNTKRMSVVAVVLSYVAVSLAFEAKAADGVGDKVRDGRPVRPVSSAPDPTVDKIEPVLLRSISLSSILEAAGIETEADVGRFLTSLFPPSFELLTGGGIVVTDTGLVEQFTGPSTRPGVSQPIPDPAARSEDSEPIEVLLFAGWVSEYGLSGRVFVAGDELVVDLQWTDSDGAIVLGESIARTIKVSSPAEGTTSAVGNRVIGIYQKSWKCKCSHDSGACSTKQCNNRSHCYTGDNNCNWVWTTVPQL